MTQDAKVGPEGRVVIPAAIRQALGVKSGDRVRFVLDEDGNVSVVPVRALVFALWANNHGGDAGDSVALMREVRTADQANVEAKLERVQETVDASAERSDEELAAEVFAMLGLNL